MKRLPHWLGSLLAPAEDPRRYAPAAPAEPEALLAALRRSRRELESLRANLNENSPIYGQLTAEQEALSEAERALLGSVDEARARAALLRARRVATEAELLADS